MSAEWFAGRLRELRESAGLTQQQLADAAGLKLGGVRHLEQGTRSPTWETVVALCAALGVDCTAFAVAPKDAPAPKRGRPRKVEDAEVEGPAGPVDPAPPSAKKGRKRKGG